MKCFNLMLKGINQVSCSVGLSNKLYGVAQAAQKLHISTCATNSRHAAMKASKKVWEGGRK